MNGSRSTYMRKGYLLTALAAAVLLAASSGTAFAQSVGFIGTSPSSMTEGASTAANTPAPLNVVVRRTGVTPTDTLGAITLSSNAGTGAGKVPVVITVPGAGSLDLSTGVLTFINDDIVLQIVSTQDDEQWETQTLILELASDAIADDVSPHRYTVTVNDTNNRPTVQFDLPKISLTEGSNRTMTPGVEIDLGKPVSTQVDATSLATAFVASSIKFAPSSGAVVAAACDPTADSPPVLAISGAGVAAGTGDDAGLFLVPQTGGVLAGTNTSVLAFEACDDSTGFQDTTITLSFVATSLKGVGGGTLSSRSLDVEILSNEEIPTVSFATDAFSIDEGSSQSVGILAEGMLAGEVSTATVTVAGEAMISLWQGSNEVPIDDGSATIDLSASARLTIMAESDPDLMDGATKTATLTITDADGADVDPGNDTLTVTVNGSTAVPALPLIGQLLLALFLMAGGARLYRRRQG